MMGLGGRNARPGGAIAPPSAAARFEGVVPKPSGGALTPSERGAAWALPAAALTNP